MRTGSLLKSASSGHSKNYKGFFFFPLVGGSAFSIFPILENNYVVSLGIMQFLKILAFLLYLMVSRERTGIVTEGVYVQQTGCEDSDFT